MSSVIAATRRGLVALIAAFGLVLMHGGIGQAVACTGMDAMAEASFMSHHDMAAEMLHAQGRHAEHHQPADQPNSQLHSADMCISTPAQTSSGGAGSSPAALVVLSQAAEPVVAHRPTVSRETGRCPPPPDLISELCVNRR